MTLLSSNELEYMRTSIEGLMPGTCNILSATLASNGAGEMTSTWGTVGTAVSCRLDATRGMEAVEGASLAPLHSYILTLAHDQTIDVDYRVEIGTHTFTVTSVDLEKDWAACRRVYLERI